MFQLYLWIHVENFPVSLIFKKQTRRIFRYNLKIINQYQAV